MAKHVCPVCETVHADRGTLKMETINQQVEYESWECPSCGYRFVAVSDVQDLLERLMGKDAPKIEAHFQVSGSVS